jgi:hypothetical protein
MEINDKNIVIERLKFYADTDKEKNKYFCFTINSIMDLEERLKYFAQRMYIRSAWYECIENGKTTSNQRIDMVTFTDYNEISFIK